MGKQFDYSIPGLSFGYNVRDKKANENLLVKYMLNRTRQMFRWDGLPDSVPPRILELYLQINGNVAWYEHMGTLYVFCGGLGGTPNEYYMPTICTIANPALNLTVNARIDIDCVVMPNDSLYAGLMPLYHKYAALMAETELSLHMVAVNTRLFDLVSAQDERTKQATEQVLKEVEKGNLSVAVEPALLDALHAQPYGTSGHVAAITHLIELEQYLKAAWFNAIGLDANYNMKRESLSMAESQMNSDALMPLVDDMLECRQTAAEKVNALFGTNISVSLASSWEDNAIELAEELNNELSTDPAAEEDPTENASEDAEKDGDKDV